MNNGTTSKGYGFNSDGFRYGVAFVIGSLVLLLTVAFACVRLRMAGIPPSHPTRDEDSAEQGFDHIDTSFESYPKLLYSQVEKGSTSTSIPSSSCSICLGDYKEGDILSSEESVLLLVSFIILTLIVTLAAYLCSTDIPRTTPSVPAAVTHSNHTTITVEAPEPCIDQSVCNFPNLQFSKTKLCGSTSSSSSSCSICLMDYKDRDSLRVLPACGHFFHVKCVDPWLRINMTCPVCRTPITLSDVTKTF
ncbi:RING-H2 finger protein ATL70-like [Vigna radiata var. radiata]|uniref:RING-H2 finger protein ATL70-like n=1 Tax=Vigna radiata var. radiata TaxID=3916 RepID=A0A1S3V0Q1_VIGRR|nr:RING-H2 finger protein ATL70-like [Vigna radiata var. radiata]